MKDDAQKKHVSKSSLLGDMPLRDYPLSIVSWLHFLWFRLKYRKQKSQIYKKPKLQEKVELIYAIVFFSYPSIMTGFFPSVLLSSPLAMSVFVIASVELLIIAISTLTYSRKITLPESFGGPIPKFISLLFMSLTILSMVNINALLANPTLLSLYSFSTIVMSAFYSVSTVLAPEAHSDQSHFITASKWANYFENRKGKYQIARFLIGTLSWTVCFFMTMYVFEQASPLSVIQMIPAFLSSIPLTLTTFSFFASLPVVVYLQTYFEELFFRGVPFILTKKTLFDRTSFAKILKTILLSSFAFSIMHIQHVISMGWMGVLLLATNYFPSSIMWGLNVVLTSGIEYTHGIHFMNNFIIITATYSSFVLAGAEFTTISQIFVGALQSLMILGAPTLLCLFYHFGTIALSNYFLKQGESKKNCTGERESVALKSAISAFEKSAWLGNAKAMFELAKLYQGNNDNNSKKYYEKAAKKGHAGARLHLGVMYKFGQGVKKDYKKAFEWFEKAAEQGDEAAQYNLGVMYDQGQGVKPDYAKAFEWYEKAADQGISDAQFNLGMMLHLGEGVEQNDDLAVKYFRKVSAQENANLSKNVKAYLDSCNTNVKKYGSLYFFSSKRCPDTLEECLILQTCLPQPDSRIISTLLEQYKQPNQSILHKNSTLQLFKMCKKSNFFSEPQRSAVSNLLEKSPQIL